MHKLIQLKVYYYLEEFQKKSDIYVSLIWLDISRIMGLENYFLTERKITGTKFHTDKNE